MNKKHIYLASAALIAIIAILGVYFFWPKQKQNSSDSADRQAVQSAIENFGKALKNVSLFSPAAEEDMRKNYSNYVAPELLDIWSRHPMQALGRLVSSPWPDRIEVSDINKLDPNTYIVIGKIIELASEEKTNGKIASSQQAGFALIRAEGGKWLISSAALTKESNGVIFQYPVNLPVKYVSAQDWPPSVKIKPGEYSCIQTPPTSSLAQIRAQRTTGGRVYCVDFKSEGLPGSVNLTYNYTTQIEKGRLLDVSFVLNYVNCANYEKEANQICSAEREIFNPDDLVDEIVTNLIVR